MYSIISSGAGKKHLEQFREWVEKEWGAVDSFSGTVEGFLVPAPILAIDEQELMGGLGFTSSTKPDSEDTGIWVNVLLVASKYRNKGIGSQLIQAAEAAASHIKVKELFVYTDVPAIYQKLDWSIVEEKNESTVLKKFAID